MIVNELPNILPDVDTALDHAVAHHEAGRLDLARSGYQAILSQDPEQADALNLLGLLEQDAGNLPDAITLLERALEVDPDFPEALTNLARARRANRDPGEAADLAQRAIQLDPELAEAQLQLGLSLFDLKRYAESLGPLQLAVAALPNLLEARLTLGNVRMKSSDIQGALRDFEYVLDHDPDRLQALVNASMCLLTMGHAERALRYQHRAVSVAPNDASAHAALALSLQQAGDIDGSMAACQAALGASPEYHDALVLLGTSMVALGRFNEAEAYYRRALATDTDSGSARAGLASIRVEDWSASDIGMLTDRLRDDTLSRHNRAVAGFALGSVLDRDGKYADAFAAYKAANTLALANRHALGHEFDLDGMRHYVDWATRTFTPSLFKVMKERGNPSYRPVFIVGMPRSGTTLVEQIAASHSSVFGAGELRTMSRLVSSIDDNPGNRSPLLWDRQRIREKTEQYLEELAALAPNSARIIDKLPDNVQIVGQIAALFPNASIIVCRRDLRDVCLSCYFQNFHEGLEWTFDLDACVGRAEQVERLMDHWIAALPGQVFELCYERLTEDLEGESRRLIEFLGLPWEPACLDFQNTERVVRTASQWQVRQPIYSKSVGRWKRYESFAAAEFARLSGIMAASAKHRLAIGFPPEGSHEYQSALCAALIIAGESESAERVAREVAETYPNAAESHILLGEYLLTQKKHEEAIAVSRRALALAPDNPRTRYLQASALSGAFKYDEAEKAWYSVLELTPEHPEALLALGRVLFERGRFVQASEVYRRLVDIFPGQGETHDSLASVLSVIGDAKGAAESAREASRLEPANATYKVRLGESLSILGDFVGAEAAFRAALTLNPTNASALAALVKFVRRQTSLDDLKALESLYDDESAGDTTRAVAGYGLAQALDKSGDFERAFTYGDTANKLIQSQRASRGHTYDRNEVTNLITSVIQTYTIENVTRLQKAGNPSEVPVYIVGLPRSGTSLVEQILASHPQVHGRGETKDIDDAVIELNAMTQAAGRPIWLPSEIRAKADELLNKMQGLAPDASRVTDKLPDNIIHAGQIACLFPKARIIFCRRDLRDIGLSCFFENFMEGLEWTFDMGDIGFHAYQIERLALHWHHVLPMRMFDIQYETLVGDLEGESRRLIEFLGLEWDPACLAFHKNKREVSTASLWQVRQPVYSSSVGRWRNYRKHLAPMMEHIQGLIQAEPEVEAEA